MKFWGRQRELARLRDEFDAVGKSGEGRMLAIRGRRQVGKSRLLTQFAETTGSPYLFATALKHASLTAQLSQLTTDLHASRVPLANAELAFAATPASWVDLFSRLGLAIGSNPAIVVIDEFPWAVETDDTLEGTLQHAWDRTLERLPVLLVLVGSDVAMMERLTGHDRPLYGRAGEMTISTFTPAEVAEALPDDRSATDVLDVYLTTGGYPRLVSSARAHASARAFVHSQLQDDQSPLSVTGLRMLDAEFRDDVGSRAVLEAIGAVEIGHASFSSAVSRLGDDAATAGTAVTRALPALVSNRGVVAIDTPVGAKPSTRLRRYRIVDPYLRFWFRYCSPHLAAMARGRSDLAIDSYARDFPSWRGKTIEPIVHEAVFRLASQDARLAGLVHVGAWWDRTGTREVDVVGALRSRDVAVIGTIKWRMDTTVSATDVAEIAAARAVVPRAGAAALLVVCPAGVQDGAQADIVLDATDIVHAFR